MIRLEYVNMSFGHRQVLRDLSLMIGKSEAFCRDVPDRVIVMVGGGNRRGGSALADLPRSETRARKTILAVDRG